MALRMQSCVVNQYSNAQGQQENLLQNEMLTETDSIDLRVDTEQTKESCMNIASQLLKT